MKSNVKHNLKDFYNMLQQFDGQVYFAVFIRRPKSESADSPKIILRPTMLPSESSKTRHTNNTKDLRVQFNAKQSSTTKLSPNRNINTFIYYVVFFFKITYVNEFHFK